VQNTYFFFTIKSSENNIKAIFFCSGAQGSDRLLFLSYELIEGVFLVVGILFLKDCKKKRGVHLFFSTASELDFFFLSFFSLIHNSTINVFFFSDNHFKLTIF